MLNFFISTISFSISMYTFNQYLDSREHPRTRSRTVIVMVLATLVSIGVGMVIDQLDGEAELNKNDPSLVDIVKSGDPLKLTKRLTGFS